MYSFVNPTFNIRVADTNYMSIKSCLEALCDLGLMLRRQFREQSSNTDELIRKLLNHDSNIDI